MIEKITNSIGQPAGDGLFHIAVVPSIDAQMGKVSIALRRIQPIVWPK